MCLQAQNIDEVQGLPIILRTEESLDDFLDNILIKSRKVVQVSEDKLIEFNEAIKAYKESCQKDKEQFFKRCLLAACHVKLAAILFNLTPDNSPEERVAAGLEVSFW